MNSLCYKYSQRDFKMNYYYPNFLGNYYEKSQMSYPQQKQNSNNQICNGFDKAGKTSSVTKSMKSVKIDGDNKDFVTSDIKNCSVKTSDKTMCYGQKNFQAKLCDSLSSQSRFSPCETVASDDLRISG